MRNPQARNLADLLARQRNIALSTPLADLDAERERAQWFTVRRDRFAVAVGLFVIIDPETIAGTLRDPPHHAGMWCASFSIVGDAGHVPLQRCSASETAARIWAQANVFAGIGNPRYQAEERRAVSVIRYRLLARHEITHLERAAGARAAMAIA